MTPAVCCTWGPALAGPTATANAVVRTSRSGVTTVRFRVAQGFSPAIAALKGCATFGFETVIYFGDDGRAPVPAASRLPLSSTARLRTAGAVLDSDFQRYVQRVVPSAGCQVAPPSVDTSTPATTPPPASDAL